MAKKKKAAQKSSKIFQANPFSELKGFAASKADKKPGSLPEISSITQDVYGSFAEEMEMLGVQPLQPGKEIDQQETGAQPGAEGVAGASQQLTEEQLFLAAMNNLDVRFEDVIPNENSPVLKATPRRMKQLRQGRIKIEAKVDLHGCHRHEAVPRLRYFFQNAAHQGWETLLIVTGKGLHSADGEAVLRDAAEDFLIHEAAAVIAEWGRAPKEFGGDGALVVFLKKKTD